MKDLLIQRGLNATLENKKHVDQADIHNTKWDDMKLHVAMLALPLEILEINYDDSLEQNNFKIFCEKLIHIP